MTWRNWTADEIAYLRLNYRRLPAHRIAKELGRPVAAIAMKANRLGLSRARGKKRLTEAAYLEALRNAAKEAHEPVAKVMTSSQSPYATARARAWASLREQGCCIDGIAKVSGFHRSAIGHALRRLTERAA